MNYLIKIKKGGFWHKEKVSSIFLFNRLCELIDKNKDIEVYTVAGQTEYLSLIYKDGILKIKNLNNEKECKRLIDQIIEEEKYGRENNS